MSSTLQTSRDKISSRWPQYAGSKMISTLARHARTGKRQRGFDHSMDFNAHILDANYNTRTHKFCSIIADRQGQLLKTACGSPCYAAPEMIAGATGRADGDPANLPSIVVRSNQTADIVDSWNISHNVLLYALQSVCNISCIFIFVECCSGHSYAHVSDQCVWRCRCMHACFYSSEFFTVDFLYSSIFRWSFYFVSIISILTWIWGASPLRPLELWSYSFRSCLWILTLWGHGCFKERGIDDSENWNLADRLDLCRIRTLLPCTKRYWLRTTRRLNSSARWGMAISSHKFRRIQPAPCQSVRDLIAKLLTTDPTRRYNVPDVRAHPWSGP